MPKIKNPVWRSTTAFPSNKTVLNRNNKNHKYHASQGNDSINLKGASGQDRGELKNKSRDEEVIQYFSEVAFVMEKGFESDSEKGHFIENVLDQTVGKEVKLSCDRFVSRCIEKLLEDCSNPYVMLRFMEAFSHNLYIVVADQCASHIAEKLLHSSLLIVKNISSFAEPADVEEKNNTKMACLFWGYRFGQFCCQHLEQCVNDVYGCHVLSAVIQFLGCCHVSDSALLNKKLQKRDHIHENQTDHGNSLSAKEIFPSVPIIFMDLLKNIATRITEYTYLSDLIFDSRSSPMVQILLLVLKKRDVKYFSKINQVLLSTVFSARNCEGIPLALYDRSCSYLIEKIIGLSDEHGQELIWLGINEYLPQLISHRIGNYTIQGFFYSVHSKQQFESMFDSIVDHFEEILENHHFGIWLSIAKSCNRLKTRQVQFLTKVMQVLKCSEPAERNSYLAPLLLGLETYERHMEKVSTTSQPSSLRLNLFGSLILQEILKFSKPFKTVRSILAMKSEMLMSLVCQEQGCHVLLSFLESTNVAKKDKDKLIQQLKPELVSVACDFTGNLTLCRMWSLLSLDQKVIIAKELTEKKASLLQHKCGVIIFKKFALFHFEKHMDTWKGIQQSLEKKQQIFKEIIA